ncbi:putative helicase family. Dicer subfamily protein [Lyophyllum shimeji]|uniref:Helicase family. Dicer subfamily protein n=1 Tax=Lyophyllum shimeji TaxID=47721 RepID=A0A9P3UN01_LYOSH|nr:putative helicase family. Dicer subfamily protein [Lyophyllum shimeji]
MVLCLRASATLSFLYRLQFLLCRRGQLPSVFGLYSLPVMVPQATSPSLPCYSPDLTKLRGQPVFEMGQPDDSPAARAVPTTRGYQQEMLEESLRRNIIIALDTGSGKTHIAVLRMKIEAERQPTKISWFLAPTVALCEQQRSVIQTSIAVSVGLISGSLEPDQWKDAALWRRVLNTHRIMVTTPQVLLDALRHSYISLGRDISLLVFDEAHHAVDNHPYNRIMKEFYFDLPWQTSPVSVDIQRPSVLGLTASPIYGGNVVRAFKTIEENLDSIIRAPRRHREELAKFVHRPVFRHVMYGPPDELNPPFSTNVASLYAVSETLNIEDDPYVKSLRQQLSRAARGTPEYYRLDQKLSKVILKKDSFTHKGLRDFARTAGVICEDLGAWAADWYVWGVIEHAKRAANPYNNIISTWKNEEKVYLLSILERVAVMPVSFYPDDVLEETSDKVRALIDTLLFEKFDAEAANESYSGLVFVQRRDTVLALAEVLKHHPSTRDVFKFGCLLGTSDNSQRHSFLDITRTMLKESHEDTLMDFKIGEKTVIISTAVAEEGIDIQACGSVIRWDPPPNMASWAQSRGRARRERSTYTMMFARGGTDQSNVSKWQNLEREMVALYNDPSRESPKEQDCMDEDEDDDVEFRVPSTGALLTLHSAVAHLSHFCAVIPNTAHADNRPLYDIDPPEMVEGWHSFDNRSTANTPLYNGPFGSTVTLPRSLPLPNRVFSTERIYKNRISAHRHAAFMAYRALYDAELLNQHLLPITSIVEPHLEDEVKEMLKDIEKRAGMASVSLQMSPWMPEDGDVTTWNTYELIIDGLPPLRFLTLAQPFSLPGNMGPTLYRSGHDPLTTRLRYLGRIALSDPQIGKARLYTRMLFWSLNGSRMAWDKLDFSYLVLPTEEDAQWETRRSWLSDVNRTLGLTHADEFSANAEKFGEEFAHPTDLSIVRNGFRFAKAFRFVGWRYEPLSREEEEELRTYYARFDDLEITYPLLVVKSLPARTNFLIPTPRRVDGDLPAEKSLLLLPRLSSITLLSPAETEYAFLLPSILRSLALSLTVNSMRRNLFASSPLYDVPLPLLLTAMTAPVSGELSNYQRLETLGDTVLKFVVGIQLLAEYPLWHEGYLTKKENHAVANVRLAKEDIKRGIYRWIIRDRMLGKKWKPCYLTAEAIVQPEAAKPVKEKMDIEKVESISDSKKKPKQRQELSTKVLADVVESLIGAAYLHGGFDLGYECAKFFDLGLKWEPLPSRIETLLSRVDDHEDLSPQLSYVEQILGYTFRRKLLLVEALTHASYEQNQQTPSYERMEFLGDSVLDMVVTHLLYHAPGKNYSPGHIHLRKSAMVNAHILAYICLSSSTPVDATMPGPTGDGHIALQPNTHLIYLWQCLLHSSPRILEDQRNTCARYRLRQSEIEASLKHGTLFPWAELLRLQAPKFFSDMVESLLGAVFLDSNGNLDVARDVTRKLGILPILERIVREDVDVLHPVSRLSMWASKHDKELEYRYYKEKGNVSCAIVVDGVEECRFTEQDRGRASQEEVKYMAAEDAIKVFRLRDVNVNYTLLKKKHEGPSNYTHRSSEYQVSNDTPSQRRTARFQ